MLNFFHIHECEVFIKGSAPCHKVKKVKKFLEEHQINVLEWPGNSPDLNPIRNCWQKMKKLMAEKNTPNLDTLYQSLKKVGVIVSRRCQWNILEI